jgi:hypothetical protein
MGKLANNEMKLTSNALQVGRRLQLISVLGRRSADCRDA